MRRQTQRLVLEDCDYGTDVPVKIEITRYAIIVSVQGVEAFGIDYDGESGTLRAVQWCPDGEAMGEVIDYMTHQTESKIRR